MSFRKPGASKTQNRVLGHFLPGPRLTRAGYWALLLYICAPMLAALLLLDGLLWLLFHYVLERCYGIGCWLG